MNLASILLWGWLATMVLTTCLAASQGLGLSRMSLPLMLGAAFTGDRQRANVYGFVLHFVNGWLFALVYALAFESWHRATWWLGAILGLAQALFILAAVMPLLPYVHRRMATEEFGPNPTRQLEPPGFMALNYGRLTPVATVLAHLLYGAILGACYSLAPR
ncbi:MAG TPA: hypothetical protein VE075_00135 [Thermoanaerobaculia bacterium]|nr:hypothetical protein [Thermoanaerobaculia bacterium]